MSDPFTALPDYELDALVGQTPICWIVPHASPDSAILMPVLLERDAVNRDITLIGHLPRGAPAAAVLKQQPIASFLYLGPHAYISPATAGRRDWAPTWNFASARLTGQVTLDEELTRTSVEALVSHMEGSAGWRIEELGPRVDALLARIVGFRAAVNDAAPRFKLGQDEDRETFAAIASALRNTKLGAWMARIRAGDR